MNGVLPPCGWFLRTFLAAAMFRKVKRRCRFPPLLVDLPGTASKIPIVVLKPVQEVLTAYTEIQGSTRYPFDSSFPAQRDRPRLMCRHRSRTRR